MMRVRAALAMLAATTASLLTMSACGGSQPRAPSGSERLEPRWQDVFDRVPDVFVVVRPRTLRQDRMYGPLLAHAVAAARANNRVVAATRALDAVEDADEVLVGVDAGSSEGRDLVVVTRGVRADLDPGKLSDGEGRALWEPGPSAAVRELVCERDAHGTDVGASLFELPGRTWVIASGEARERARDVFAHPVNRPIPELDRDALAIVRLDGPSLVQHTRQLQGTGALSAAGHHLQWAAAALTPGEQGVRATLSYADDDSAGLAEISVREALLALGRSKSERFAWLGKATVERSDRRVVIHAPLPPELVEAFVRAAGTRPPGEASPPAKPAQ